MRILGSDLGRMPAEAGTVEHTLVLLDDEGRVQQIRHATSLPEVAAGVGRLAGGEPFLLGVNVPVVVPATQSRARPVENLVRRRFGVRLPHGGRAADSGEVRVVGETLMAGLAAAGQPCLPYPDRDRRQPGLAEIHPALTLKSLLWESSPLASAQDRIGERVFRSYAPPVYRTAKVRSRSVWADHAAAMDLLLRVLGEPPGFDLEPAREALGAVGSDRDAERAAGILDASLIAGTARRYLDSPETCLFLGDREQGYVILPADARVRRLALGAAAAPRGRLFPQASLRERLGRHAQLREVELLTVPGRPQRTEASFKEPPRYEFDNLDELLWWKHCRHVGGVSLPTDGLTELSVVLERQEPDEALKLSRSRHQTLSFRFEPPAAWRAWIPTRDGKTYPFRVLRAVYETLPPVD